MYQEDSANRKLDSKHICIKSMLIQHYLYIITTGTKKGRQSTPFSHGNQTTCRFAADVLPLRPGGIEEPLIDVLGG